MNGPPRQDPPAPDDRTRDITLPPLPDRPQPVLPREWRAAPSADPPTTAVPAPAGPPPGAGSTPPPTGISREEASARIEARGLASQPTDRLAHEPRGRRPHRTLAFTSPEMRDRPVAPVAVGRTARRWPWVVLTVLPVLVIVGAAVAWVILVRTA